MADEVDGDARTARSSSTAPPTQIFDAPQTPYTQALMAAAFDLEAVGADSGAVAT